MRKVFTAVLLASAGALVLGGCAPSMSGSVYRRGETGMEQTVRLGVVESVRQVMIEGTKSPVGTVAGAGVGGVAGSRIGQGRGAVVGTIAGVVIGGLAGSALEEGVTRRHGLEITVRLENGELRAIVQESDEEFKAGEKVRLVSNGRTTRVTH